MHVLQGREEDVLQELEFAVVTVRHVAAEHVDLIFDGHDTVAVSAHDLPNVRVLLVRHDARAGCKFIRELDESVVRTHVHAAVGCKFVEGQSDRSHSSRDGLFGLAAAELRCNYVIIEACKAKKVCCHLAVERERTSVSCCRSERILVGYIVCSAKHVHVVCKSLGICSEPETE